MVRRLAADGLAVVAADLREGERVDVADPDSAQALAERVLEQHGRLDVLVNNAGIAGPTADVVDYPPDAFARVLAVNLLGTFHMTRACLPAMVAAGWGRIVNIASIAGKDGNAGMSAYSASKAGVIGFTKSVAKETAQTGVLVNCLVPGVIDAGLTTHTATAQERELFRSRVPMGRMGRPEELAELASWLCSERCSFSTGATYDLSGGRAVY
jgi:NAD(P)-dependent dehydrogenase (short-subunit alcohol dehydrogenase family)